LNYGCEPSMLP